MPQGGIFPRAWIDACDFGQCHLQEIHFLWRPFLSDADDDMVLELALAAGCQYIIAHNVKDFEGCRQLGVVAMPPAISWIYFERNNEHADH